MRASEETFYDVKRLHRLFAVSAVAMLAVTVWMVAADHWRPWKVYQRTFRDEVEPWFTGAAIRQLETDQFPAREEDLTKAQADRQAARDRLQQALDQQSPSAAKRLLGLPLVDALGRPVAIDQVWLPELTIDYNFRHVARFDRCPTCHAGIGKAAPGSASEPAYRPRERLSFRLVPPKEPPKAPEGVEPTPQEALRAAYGFSLAPRGILDPAEVTVGLVLPRTPAARAGLAAGDVLAGVASQAIGRREDVARLLLGDVAWGKPLEVEVWRGLPHPFRSHPRLDLFVGPESPHPLGQFGCTICHDGQGSATEFTFASHTPNDPTERARWRQEHGWSWNHDWDLPMRPARFAESNCLKCHHDVSDLEPSRRFPDPPAEKLLAGYHLIRQSGCFGCHEIRGVDDSGRRIGPDLRPEPGGAGPDAAAGIGPGTLPRVGPGLRSVADKLDAAFLRAWIARPSGFRPETRMPQFFGMHEHLDGRGLDEARRFEPVEIAAIAEYLRAVSRPVAPQGPPDGATGAASAERGKRLFQTRGCLACHKHADFPAAQSTQGPDLSRIGAKLSTPAGRKWLASWLRDPARHSPRTLMPNSLLEEDAKPQAADGPEPQADAKPQAAAEDVAAYLAGSAGWEPEPAVLPSEADVDDLALLHLAKTFPRPLAEKYLREGVPDGAAGLARTDAAELASPVDLAKKLRYLGRRTIRKRGCFGCHDVPGFEDAQPIGPPLSDWGRKQESQLAFEQVHRFATASEPTDGFYWEALLAKRREGFLWQKLRDPRSFDYQKTANKDYHEHLLMGRFTLTEAQREAVITFVLGLVAEPPAGRYVYRPDRRARAIVEGRKVLDKYGCAQCHTLEMERWTVDVDPAAFPPPPAAAAEYPFLKPDLMAEQVKASAQPDRRGLARLELTGMPQWSAEGKPEETEDEDGNPLVSFVLWEPAAIAGRGWPVGGAGVLVSPGQVARRRPAVGGDYARLLYPVAIAEAKAAGSVATYVEAWGWVPPPLVHEGRKVQPAWLYNYLLNPVTIRPASLLRMPKYNLSPQEAEKLVDYFAAVGGVEFPYTAGPLRPVSSLTMGGNAAPDLQDRAFDLVLDRTTYCGKCHLIGDFAPGGETWTIRAPNLDRVGQRIRPEYLRRWLANPKSVLPYTAMPVNFPPKQPLRQDLLPGTSLEQLDAVLGLLLDYDQYMKRRTSIRKLIEAGAKPKAEL